jgi:hypothetical protein
MLAFHFHTDRDPAPHQSDTNLRSLNYRPSKAPGLHWERSLPSTALFLVSKAVLRIRLRRIHMFLGLPDLDPLGRESDPDPTIVKQKM